MAVKKKATHEITANGNFKLGNASPSYVGRLAVQVDVDGTFDGSITVEARLMDADDAPWVEIAYFDLVTATDIAAGTAITADAVILIDASGLEIRLVNATQTTGQADVYAQPLVG